MSDDIVARLRRFTANTADLPTVTEAADEIEVLRFEILGFKDEIKRLRDEIELLRSTVTDCRIEIERLTAERYRQEVRT